VQPVRRTEDVAGAGTEDVTAGLEEDDEEAEAKFDIEEEEDDDEEEEYGAVDAWTVGRGAVL
jgi:hypothetical protein